MSTVRLTISCNFNEGIFFNELSTADSLDTLKLLLEAESGVAAGDQVCHAKRCPFFFFFFFFFRPYFF